MLGLKPNKFLPKKWSFPIQPVSRSLPNSMSSFSFGLFFQSTPKRLFSFEELEQIQDILKGYKQKNAPLNPVHFAKLIQLASSFKLLEDYSFASKTVDALEQLSPEDLLQLPKPTREFIVDAIISLSKQNQRTPSMEVVFFRFLSIEEPPKTQEEAQKLIEYFRESKEILSEEKLYSLSLSFLRVISSISNKTGLNESLELLVWEIKESFGSTPQISMMSFKILKRLAEFSEASLKLLEDNRLSNQERAHLALSVIVNLKPSPNPKELVSQISDFFPFLVFLPNSFVEALLQVVLHKKTGIKEFWQALMFLGVLGDGDSSFHVFSFPDEVFKRISGVSFDEIPRETWSFVVSATLRFISKEKETREHILRRIIKSMPKDKGPALLELCLTDPEALDELVKSEFFDRVSFAQEVFARDDPEFIPLAEKCLSLSSLAEKESFISLALQKLQFPSEEIQAVESFELMNILFKISRRLKLTETTEALAEKIKSVKQPTWKDWAILLKNILDDPLAFNVFSEVLLAFEEKLLLDLKNFNKNSQLFILNGVVTQLRRIGRANEAQEAVITRLVPQIELHILKLVTVEPSLSYAQRVPSHFQTKEEKPNPIPDSKDFGIFSEIKTRGSAEAHLQLIEDLSSESIDVLSEICWKLMAMNKSTKVFIYFLHVLLEEKKGQSSIKAISRFLYICVKSGYFSTERLLKVFNSLQIASSVCSLYDLSLLSGVAFRICPERAPAILIKELNFPRSFSVLGRSPEHFKVVTQALIGLAVNHKFQNQISPVFEPVADKWIEHAKLFNRRTPSKHKDYIRRLLVEEFTLPELTANPWVMYFEADYALNSNTVLFIEDNEDVMGSTLNRNEEFKVKLEVSQRLGLKVVIVELKEITLLDRRHLRYHYLRRILAEYDQKE